MTGDQGLIRNNTSLKSRFGLYYLCGIYYVCVELRFLIKEQIWVPII